MRSVPTRSFAIAVFATLSTAALINVTIDDENGDASTGLKPQYLPQDGWAQGSRCPQCHITQLADPSQAFDGTWHDSTYHPGSGQLPSVVQINFNGSAIYVYNMVANMLSGTTTLTNLTFSIDGIEVGQYTHIPLNDPAQPILYRNVVYRNDSLAPTLHMLSIEARGPTPSLILFDYVIYTTEEDATTMTPAASEHLTPTTSSDTQFGVSPLTVTSTPSVSVDGFQSSPSKSSAVAVGSAVGAAVGVFAALATLAIGVFVFRRRGSLPLPLFIRKMTDVQNSSRPPSSKGVGNGSSQSSPVSLIPHVCPRSPMAPSQDTSPESPSFKSDLVFAPIASPSPRHSGSRLPTPLATPPAHRADVPAPAISATGTEHSIRLADLTREIAELEAYMRGLHSEEKGRRKSSRGEAGYSEETSFGALRERVARLRVEMEAERRLLSEALPREKRRNPWSLKGRRLRVVNPEEASNA